ncbi:DUF86 domain-containing protein [Aquabacter cavernae]|uniref:HepT-like ribonuclease domain-containing protein n=1 Tax=Aquabacter cavernae TaxID=2496029 RepID=UPI0013DFE163|nr:HepT-like ribonuclease domain-containing protein [Aquabacter cavernae]
MKQAIGDIRALLEDALPERLDAHRPTRAAFERFLEIVSEASRGIPEDWKLSVAPDVPWRRVADLGNHIRHAYHRVDTEILWNIYVLELDGLERAVDAMLARFGGPPEDTEAR